jgi:hypothetical protein
MDCHFDIISADFQSVQVQRRLPFQDCLFYQSINFVWVVGLNLCFVSSYAPDFVDL